VQIVIGEWRIRSYERGDVDALARYANNRSISIHLRDRFPYPYTRKDARDSIDRARVLDPETHFAIATASELIGGIGFQPQEDVYRLSAEIGYWIAEPYWGRGIATRAVRAVSEYAFARLDIVRLYACVFAGNAASERVLEKAGYQCEGNLRRCVFKENRLLDQKIYALLRE
jgi:ribosomal-protein-alanine N-acetyltransferase